MTTTQWGAALTMPVTEDRDHIQGPTEAAVTLVEYGDYECPSSPRSERPKPCSSRRSPLRHRQELILLQGLSLAPSTS